MVGLLEVQADMDLGCKDPWGRLDQDHRDRDLQDTEDPNTEMDRNKNRVYH